jgi:hypothetical protein
MSEILNAGNFEPLTGKIVLTSVGCHIVTSQWFITTRDRLGGQSTFTDGLFPLN